jgi:hypothetical protein
MYSIYMVHDVCQDRGPVERFSECIRSGEVLGSRAWFLLREGVLSVRHLVSRSVGRAESVGRIKLGQFA